MKNPASVRVLKRRGEGSGNPGVIEAGSKSSLKMKWHPEPISWIAVNSTDKQGRLAVYIKL